MIGSGKNFDSYTFYKRDPQPADELGNERTGWVEKFTQRGTHPRFLRGGEDVLAQRLEGTQPAILGFRKSSQIDEVSTDWKCQSRNGTEFNVRAVNPTEDRQYVEFLVESGVALG